LSDREESEEIDVEPYSPEELAVIRDYLYKLQRFELTHMVETTKKSYLASYDLINNMYVFHAVREGRVEKFVCWRERIIHFG
jgi:hypothetical protein